MNDTKFTPDFIKEQWELATKAIPVVSLTIMRYDHGGGRLYLESEAGRELVAYFYHHNDREYWISAANNYPAVLDEIERLTKELDRARAEIQRLQIRYNSISD